MKPWLSVLLAALCSPASGQENKPVPPEHPAHRQLRALRDELQDAFNKEDLDRLLRHVHPNAVLTWQDGQVSRGHEGVRKYYDRMMTGPDRVVDRVTARAEVDELTILHGDSNGLAFGSLAQDFRLTDGTELHLDSRWTAHVVRDGDRWLLSGFHVSANLFDNAVLSTAIRRTAFWVGGGALLGGILLGVLWTWVYRRFLRRPTA